MVRVVFGTPHPVCVPREHLHGAAQVAAVPDLDLAVAPGADQRERLVRIIVNAPMSRHTYKKQITGNSVVIRNEAAAG